jgi:hypothetical protein
MKGIGRGSIYSTVERKKAKPARKAVKRRTVLPRDTGVVVFSTGNGIDIAILVITFGADKNTVGQTGRPVSFIGHRG